jgi:16S rRNA (cytosine1402-N4)-methyltransferase
MGIIHVPVMRKEVLENLALKEAGIYVDATLGLGGHAEGILQNTAKCVLIGIDRDEEALKIAGERLRGLGKVHIIRDSFSNIKSIVKGLGYSEVDGILFDLGFSTLQMKSDDRGFSFLKDEPLDMRMDRRQELTAETIVNSYNYQKLADLIWRFGEERRSRRIARAIVFARDKKRIRSCKELAAIIEKSIGRKQRIHPATRTFQALRIEVNRELEEVSKAIDEGADILKKEGRLCVLAYHSLEDRIVKNAYKKLAVEGIFNIITKKPLIPRREEQKENPSSRSAKLRVAERA